MIPRSQWPEPEVRNLFPFRAGRNHVRPQQLDPGALLGQGVRSAPGGSAVRTRRRSPRQHDRTNDIAAGQPGRDASDSETLTGLHFHSILPVLDRKTLLAFRSQTALWKWIFVPAGSAGAGIFCTQVPEALS